MPGNKPGGKDPQPPTSSGPQDKDQINLTDEQSRIMKTAGGSFDQCYNAQAGVDTDSMLIVGAFVTQACNDKQQVTPMLERLKAHVVNRPQEEAGLPAQLLADTGLLQRSECEGVLEAGIEPLIAMKRDRHHPPLLDRWTEPAALSAGADAVTTMAHRLKTKAGRADYGLRKQTVEPVFGIIKQVMNFRQFLLRGIEKVGHEWNLVALAWNLKRMMTLKMAR